MENATYIIPRTIEEQISDLRKSNVSEESIKTFLELSVRTGKISKEKAASLMTAA